MDPLKRHGAASGYDVYGGRALVEAAADSPEAIRALFMRIADRISENIDSLNKLPSKIHVSVRGDAHQLCFMFTIEKASYVAWKTIRGGVDTYFGIQKLKAFQDRSKHNLVTISLQDDATVRVDGEDATMDQLIHWRSIVQACQQKSIPNQMERLRHRAEYSAVDLRSACDGYEGGSMPFFRNSISVVRNMITALELFSRAGDLVAKFNPVNSKGQGATLQPNTVIETFIDSLDDASHGGFMQTLEAIKTSMRELEGKDVPQAKKRALEELLYTFNSVKSLVGKIRKETRPGALELWKK